MRYKVYDTVRKRFVTDDTCIVLKPDGRLVINEHGDEIVILTVCWIEQSDTVRITMSMRLAEFMTLDVVGHQMAVIVASVPTLAARLVVFGTR